MDTYAEFFRKTLCLNDTGAVRKMEESAKREAVHRGMRIVENGEVQSRLAFLLRGTCRGYVIDENGREITDCFLFQPGDVVMGCNELGEPSQIAIEALTDCELVWVPMQVLVQLLQNHPQAYEVYSRLLQDGLKRHWDLKRVMYQPALQRYQWFLENYPGLDECVSGKHVASFLGITPVTLSRLRRQMREMCPG